MITDSQLQSDVQTELEWQPSLSPTQIGAAVKDGVVTLTGEASQYAEKTAATDAAKRVYGIKAVANDITVQRTGLSQRTDADIATAAVNAMAWDSQVPPDKVMVMVSDGWVTLSGTVDLQYQKDAAERCVRYLLGVLVVTNSIEIKSGVITNGVKDKIEDAFRRSADIDARRIRVRLIDGEVFLTGSVSSCSERSEAEMAA